MKFIFFLYFVFCSIAVVAQEAAPPVRLLLATGAELRPEKDVNSDLAQHILRNYALGVGYENFIFILERANFDESSGNASLSVSRNLQDSMLWVQWRAQAWNRIVPYVGGGIGVYKEKIKTQLISVSAVENETPQRFLSGACFGLNLDIPVLWLSVEGRILVGDELDQQPTLGGLARIGLWF